MLGLVTTLTHTRRYRHYSPDAKVILLEGSGVKISEIGPKRVAELLRAGKKVGVIVTHHSSVYPQENSKCTPDSIHVVAIIISFQVSLLVLERRKLPMQLLTDSSMH